MIGKLPSHAQATTRYALSARIIDNIARRREPED